MGKTKHKPVLLDEVLALLDPKPADRCLDLTAGYGGHVLPIARMVGAEGSLTLVDRDDNAIAHLKKMFKDASNVQIIHSDFLSASQELLASGQKFDVILADLGASSIHFDEAERGFSFAAKGPLDMRMDQRQKRTAADVVNQTNPAELTRILREYGEVRGADKLTKKIVQLRPITDTKTLAELVLSVSPRDYRSRIHPATKVFQALRISVNQELEQLKKALPIWIDLLNTGGKLGVISFHSLEDRYTKQSFQFYGGNRYDAKLQTVTKNPVTASNEEVVFNPRARSAKLRVAQRK